TTMANRGLGITPDTPGVPAPQQFDFGDPTRTDLTMADRVASQQFIRAYDKRGPFSVFEGVEGERAKQQLITGPATTSAAMLSNMARTLPNDVYAATMSSQPMQEALNGMIRTYDPAKQTAAFQTMEKLRRDDPLAFAKFGDDARKSL